MCVWVVVAGGCGFCVRAGGGYVWNVSECVRVCGFVGVCVMGRGVCVLCVLLFVRVGCGCVWGCVGLCMCRGVCVIGVGYVCVSFSDK